MTKEEQIDWLCRLRADLNNGVIFSPWNKEFTEALNGVLQQEPCDDCINNELLKAAQKIQQFCYNLNNCDGCPFKKDGSCLLLDGEPETWEV